MAKASLSSVADDKKEAPEEKPKPTKAEVLDLRDVKMKAVEVGLTSILQGGVTNIAGVSNKHHYVRSCVHQVFVLAEIVEQEYIKFYGKD